MDKDTAIKMLRTALQNLIDETSEGYDKTYEQGYAVGRAEMILDMTKEEGK